MTTLPAANGPETKGRRRRDRPGVWVAIIILAHIGLGLTYDRATPIFEASDEGSHYAVVDWLANGNGLPVQVRSRLRPLWAQEGSQPPLYYWLASRLVALVPDRNLDVVYVLNPLSRVGIPGTPHNANLYRHPLERPPMRGVELAVRLVRWFSLALGAMTSFLTWRLAAMVFPGQTVLALLAAALVAFNPMTLFINASVNNDNLLMLLSTGSLVGILVFMRPHVPQYGWKAAGLGLLLGLAALTKVSGLVLWPAAAVGVAWGAWRGRDWRRFLAAGVIIAAVVLLVCGWWYWRNQMLYGEWLGLETMIAMAGPRAPAIRAIDLLRTEWYGFFLSYWGVFGVFTILPADWVFGFYFILTLWSGLGWLQTLLRRPLRLTGEILLLVLFIILTLVGVVNWSLQTLASQGRLMFGAIAPLSALMAAGILGAARPLLRQRAGRGWANGLVLTLSAALALVAGVVPPAYIAPHYAPPQQIALADLPADLQTTDVTFGGNIQLLGYTAPITPVVPGERLPVTLFWLATKPIQRDFALALHLVGRQGGEVAKIDTWPGSGNGATTQWTPGVIYGDTFWLPVADTALAPSRLWLNLNFWEDDPGRILPMTTSGGAPLASVVLPVGRLADERGPARQPEFDEGSTFDYGIELLGYDAVLNGNLALNLYWRLNAREPVPADYTVFLHVLNEQGVMVEGPADGPPLDGNWPTSAWIPGRTVVDPHTVALSSDLPPGSYNIQLGFYDPVTGSRLTAYRPDGTRWPDDMVIITVIVQP
jgi:4-amino-4-deoxy-L-arabinose transferase-like glycosyltransferase